MVRGSAQGVCQWLAEGIVAERIAAKLSCYRGNFGSTFDCQQESHSALHQPRQGLFMAISRG
jgi:hypothetical protein